MHDVICLVLLGDSHAPCVAMHVDLSTEEFLDHSRFARADANLTRMDPGLE
jgi:hypothetical protein